MSEELTEHEVVYQTRAQDYDRLIRAEDADGNLEDHLLAAIDFEGKIVADIGAGTGRLSRWVGDRARAVHLFDAAEPMLDVARDSMEALGLAHKMSFARADTRSLPLDTHSVDVAMAGWVYGHFRYWMPDGWREVVGAAIEEMARVTRPGGDLVIIETLGTGVEAPAESALDVYFDALVDDHGFTRHWERTDYLFDTRDEAIEVMGMFFGEEMAARIARRDWTRIPECTAFFHKKNA